MSPHFSRPYISRLAHLRWTSVTKAQRCSQLRMKTSVAIDDSIHALSPTTPQYHYIEGAEHLNRYEFGGYHPVAIGDTLGPNNRFSVVHKLGFGGYSTTWLARDEQSSTLVAVKISTADVQAADSLGREVKVLGRLGSIESSLPGKQSIPQMIDSFTLEGPNGQHDCLVTAIGSASVHNSKESSLWLLFQPSVARAIAAQLIYAVQFLHSQNTVHGGREYLLPARNACVYTNSAFNEDIHLGNVIFRAPEEFIHLSSEQVYERFGSPVQSAVTRRDEGRLPPCVPPTVPGPVWMGTRSDRLTLEESRCVVIDFGEVFDPTTTRKFHSNTPPTHCPPEDCFSSINDEPLSFSADIWTLACSLWELVGQIGPFRHEYSSPDSVIADAIELLGPLPDRWWRHWEARIEWYSEDGQRKPSVDDYEYRHGGMRSTWDKRFELNTQEPRQLKNIPLFEPEEQGMFLDMMRSMLVFEPGQRATADDIVRCEWFQKWAEADFKKLRNV